MKGGKREGAGRPQTDTPARHIVKARLTDEQYAKWLDLGGSRWLKRMLDGAVPVSRELLESWRSNFQLANDISARYDGHETLFDSEIKEIDEVLAQQDAPKT